MKKLYYRWLSLAIVSVFVVTSCDVSVDAPHIVEEDDLWSATSLPVFVAGVQGDFTWATAGTYGVFGISALFTDEWVHAGTWEGMRAISNGISFDNSFPEIQQWWAQTNRARWVAEEAVRRITGMMNDSEIVEEVGMPALRNYLARVSLYAGFSNRILGEYYDFAVRDGGPAQPLETYFIYALEHLERVTEYAQPGTPEHTAALGAMAQIYLVWNGTNIHIGNWSQAVQYAGEVPTAFRYEQIHADRDRERNMFRWWGFLRRENTVWGTPFTEWGTNISNPDPDADPRVQFEQTAQTGLDANRPFWRQLKYPDYSTNIALVKGTEMRLIEAEALLRANDIPGMVGKINEVRQHHGIDEINPADVNSDNAWYVLMKERGLELWLEGRRLPDLRRWQVDPGEAHVPFTVIRMWDDEPISVYDVNPGLYLRVSRDEKDSNPNI